MSRRWPSATRVGSWSLEAGLSGIFLPFYAGISTCTPWSTVLDWPLLCSHLFADSEMLFTLHPTYVLRIASTTAHTSSPFPNDMPVPNTIDLPIACTREVESYSRKQSTPPMTSDRRSMGRYLRWKRGFQGVCSVTLLNGLGNPSDPQLDTYSTEFHLCN